MSNHFCDTVSGSEKAGVGGSIPSLATINPCEEQKGKALRAASILLLFALPSLRLAASPRPEILYSIFQEMKRHIIGMTAGPP